MKKLLPALLLTLLLAVPALSTELTAGQAQSLKHIESALAVVQELSDQGIITADEKSRADALYCEQAGRMIGSTPTVAELSAISAHVDQSQGFGVFLNTVIVFAGIALLLSAVSLIACYLRDFLKSLPARLYEGAAYVCTAALLASGLVPRFNIWFLHVEPIWFVIPGALAFATCVYFSYWLHWLHPGKDKDPASRAEYFRMGPTQLHFPTVLAGLCTVVWAATAIFYHHLLPTTGVPHFLAFIATTALQSFLGFSIITMPHILIIGWLDKKQVPRSTLASFVLLLFYLVLTLYGRILPEYLLLFESGSLFMGAFVYYLGLMIMSNKWYHMSKQSSSGRVTVSQLDVQSYLILQGITIVSGLLALYMGSTFGIGSLLGIGGTFFTLYLLEKYYEIPWKGVGWAWSLLGVAVFMYFFVGFAGQHPQFFVWGMH